MRHNKPRHKKPKQKTVTRCRATGKVKFPDAASAKSEQRYRAALHASSSYVPVRVYHCDDCGQWHLTSMKEYRHETAEG